MYDKSGLAGRISRSRAIAWAVLAVVACDGTSQDGCGSDCAGGTSVPYPDPAPPGGELQTDIVRARITQHALDFLGDHLEVLLGTFFTIEDGTAVYYLDETLVNESLDPNAFIQIRDGCPLSTAVTPPETCAPATFPSQVSLDLQALSEALSLAWLEADSSGRPGIRLELEDFELSTDIAIRMQQDDFLGTGVCHIKDSHGKPALRLKGLSFDIRVGVDDSGEAPTIEGSVENVAVDLGTTDDSTLNVTVTPCNGVDDIGCADADCPSGPGECTRICSSFDFLTELGFMDAVLEPVVNAMAPSLAESVSGLLVDALAAAPLKFETQLDLGGLLGALFGHAQPLHLNIEAGTELGVEGFGPGRGLNLGLGGGVAASEAATCSAEASPPDLAALRGPPPAFTGFLEVKTDGESRIEAYDLAASASEALIAQMAWAAFQSGLVCLDIDSYDVEALAGNAFPFTAGLLLNFDTALAGLTDHDAPMIATIRPTSAPTVRLGAGRIVADGYEEPLVEVVLDDMDVSISMFLDESLLLVSTLRADLIVQVGILRTPDQALELVVNNVIFDDSHELYNELAPGADLSGLLELVVDLAVGTLLGDSLRFKLDLSETLSDALGLPIYLRINGVRRDLGPAPKDASYLSVYATLCDDKEVADPKNPTCFQPSTTKRSFLPPSVSNVRQQSLYVAPDRAHRELGWTGLPSGQARLELAPGSQPIGRYEFQVRVDHGPWSNFRDASESALLVQSPRLRVTGLHQIEVRSRVQGRYMTRSQAQQLEVWVDREPPTLEASYDGATVEIDAFDLGSPDSIALWSRCCDASGKSLWRRSGTRIDVEGAHGILEILGRDDNGNTAMLEVALDPPRASSMNKTRNRTQSAEASGCQAAPSRWLGALLLLLGLRRRRTCS